MVPKMKQASCTIGKKHPIPIVLVVDPERMENQLGEHDGLEGNLGFRFQGHVDMQGLHPLSKLSNLCGHCKHVGHHSPCLPSFAASFVDC